MVVNEWAISHHGYMNRLRKQPNFFFLAWKAVLAQNGWLLAENSDYCMQIEVFKVTILLIEAESAREQFRSQGFNRNGSKVCGSKFTRMSTHSGTSFAWSLRTTLHFVYP